MTIDVDAALRAAGGRRVGADLPALLRFSTDTRALAPGDTFVALRGERFDGHDYLREAHVRGAAAFVVDDERCLPAGAAGIVVADTTRAYLAFASVARSRTSARVVAVTGSAGKTTTRALLARMLEAAAPGKVAAAERNENNEIGVAKLFLGLPGNVAFVVTEFGARHPGDIATLAQAARPELAVLTNVGDAHLEIFGSFENLAKAKWDVFSTGAGHVLNAADETSRAFASRDGVTGTAIWFGVADGPSPPSGARAVVAGRTNLVVVEEAEAAAWPVDLTIPGDHNVANVAAAAAAAIALGMAPAAVAATFPNLRLPDGRYERAALVGFANVEIVYDAYNANRSGMLATLSSFAREPATRRIAVLGSMAELGAEAAAMHRDVGRAAAAAGLAVLLVGGEFAADIADGARAAGLPADSVVTFAGNVEAAAWLRDHVLPGDLVLLKGSRRYRLEEIRAELGRAHVG